jgi:hypothetical protein
MMQGFFTGGDATGMSTITPHYRSVKQLLQSQSFSIDEYQREYKWENACGSCLEGAANGAAAAA